MADTAVSITAIVVSGVVGPALAAWWTRDRQRADHRQELMRELRGVLDDAASALGRAKRAFEWLWVLHREGTPREDESARDGFVRWRRELADVRLCEDRLAIRLGKDHPIHLAYCVCMATLDAQRPFAWAYEKGSKGIDRTLLKQEQAHRSYNEARAAYVAAAKELVGPL